MAVVGNSGVSIILMSRVENGSVHSEATQVRRSPFTEVPVCPYLRT
jgi:hypothetical protein